MQELSTNTLDAFTKRDLLQHISRIAAIPLLSVEKAEFLGYSIAKLALEVFGIRPHTDLSTKHNTLSATISRAIQGNPAVAAGLIAFIEEAIVKSNEHTSRIIECFKIVVKQTIAGPQSMLCL